MDPRPAFLKPATASPLHDAGAHSAWRICILALSTALIAIMVVHLETGSSLVETWHRSSTFAHGWVVVLLLSVWLVWRRPQVRRFHWVNGRLTGNEYAAKGWLALAKLTGAGYSSAVIAVYTASADAVPETERGLDRFTVEMGAAVDRTLAGSGGARQ